MPYERGKYNQQRKFAGECNCSGNRWDCTVSQWTGTYETNIGEKRADRVWPEECTGEAGVRNVTWSAYSSDWFDGISWDSKKAAKRRCGYSGIYK